MTTINLTPATLELFKIIANDAGNWSGMPLLDLNAKQKGNLVQIKKAGLMKTQNEDGCTWGIFTAEGKAFAATLGINL
jgi:hypothetical protein